MGRKRLDPSKAVQGYETITPLNYPQEQLMAAIYSDDVVITHGSAGTGKTFIPSVMAAEMYARHEVKKILITRPTASCGESLGHLPGDLDEKFEPWLHPLINAMKTVLKTEAIDSAQRHGNLEYMPLQFMRGASLDNTFIIVDEAQNLTVEQAQMLVTRIGENSKLVINGDTKQIDLKRKKDSGLAWLIYEIRRQNMPVEVIEFKIEDCVRSKTCKMFLQMIDRAED